MRMEHSHLLEVLFVISNVIALSHTQKNEFLLEIIIVLFIFKISGNTTSLLLQTIYVFGKYCLYYNPLITVNYI